MRTYKDFDLGRFNLFLGSPFIGLSDMYTIDLTTGIYIFNCRDAYTDIKISLLGFVIQLTIWAKDQS